MPHCPSKCRHSGLIDAGLIWLNMARLSSERVHFLPLMTSGNNSRPFTLLSLLREQNGCSGIYFALQMNSAQRLFKTIFLYGVPASQAAKGAPLGAFFRRLIHREVMHLQIVPFFSPLCFQNPSILKSGTKRVVRASQGTLTSYSGSICTHTHSYIMHISPC